MTFFQNLPNPFGKKPEVDAVQQQYQTSEQRSLIHYRTWPVFVVYKRRQTEQILQAVGDRPAPPTPVNVAPSSITPDQLLAQIQAGQEDPGLSQPQATSEGSQPVLTETENPTDQLLAHIEATSTQQARSQMLVDEEPPIQDDDTRSLPIVHATAPDNPGEPQPDQAASQTAMDTQLDSSIEVDVNISYADIPDLDTISDLQTQSPDEGILAAFEALEASQSASATQSEDIDIADILDQVADQSQPTRPDKVS